MRGTFFKSLLLAVAFLCYGLGRAQTISGNVSDETGPLAGANVVVKGTTNGTQTDFDGNFTIGNVSEDATLVISYIGYKSSEIKINGRSAIDVVLEQDAAELEEVVLIGYGSQRKSDLTGAVGQVDAEELQERPVQSLNQSLAGRIAGVQVNTNSGRPGGKTNVRIRGFSSINSSNNPLYVVDGVQLPQGNLDQYSSAIDFLNPNDVVSIEVLKDASSTAIYGARGANGVILVTTKRGRAGQGRISYNVEYNVKEFGPNKAEVLNAEEYLMVEQLSWENSAKFDPEGWAAGNYAQYEPRLKRADPLIAPLFDSDGNPLYDTDWSKEVRQHRLSQNHQLGFSGGNERTTYALSLGINDEQGLLKNTYLKRYSGRFSIDDQIKDWVKIGGTLSYNYQTENLADTNDQVPRRMVEDFPFLPVRYPAGHPKEGIFADNRDYPFAEGTFSSVHRLDGQQYILNTQTASGSAYTNINFTDELQMRTVVGANVITQENPEFRDATLAGNSQAYASSSSNKEIFWSVENYLTYDKQINENNSLTALLGLSWQQSNSYFFSAEANNFPTDYFGYNNLGAGSNNIRVGSNSQREALNSYFGRVNYNLYGKYLFTVTGRADGSSKFGDNNKFSFFPSAAVAWRVSDEDFLKDSETISNLKLRTSYGVTGNSEIPPYSSLSLLSSNYQTIWGGNLVGGTGLNRLENPDLKWEKTAQYDLGLEVGLFNNRIAIEADVYYRKTTDMLLDAPVPQSSGYTTIRRNVGSMENKGLEISLNTVNVALEDFNWNTNFNISMNRNKVLSLATPSDIFGVGGPGITNETNIIRVGEPVGSFWGLTRLGVWGTDEADEAASFVSYRNGLTLLPGDIKYKDFNGDKIINDEDRSIIGNGYPTASGSLINNFTYKGLDLTIDLQYSWGNDVMDMNLHSSEDRQALANSYRTVLNAWTPDNQNTMIAQVRDTRAGYVTNVDSHWIKDGSFLRGRNLILGYSFRPDLLERLYLNKLRVYASTQNFFLWVNDELIGDPEVSPIRGGEGNNVFSQGMKWHEYPRATTFVLGLQVGI
ncbi:SusC/RagA family TonB-linked outer membrane protein [Pseudozobellia thermophila]|uniref:TonB-linked outer membrane protein, SusC/RagA family n=1 Tax=Pseudozobellia thermophila TaxID=192903 RepID=A0A1M6MPE2_9FLAO|nr:TonB-dependent receptor [Pseudozobellia thermophila]SHJ85327.1 TonB-linked outer membrane protein, SusC/RagA family [Pseudozobellia thermophila]